MKTRGFRRAAAVASLATAVSLPAGLFAPAPAEAYMRNHGPMTQFAGGAKTFADSDINIVENLGQRVPRGLTFVDGHGQTVSIDGYLDRGIPVVLTLGYYRCPVLCNLVHEELAKAIKASGLKVGRDFVGVAVSFDSKEEPKSANTNQARLLRSLQHDKDADWPFLLEPGTAAGVPGPTVQKLAEAVGFRFKYDEKSKEYAHPAAVIVLGPGGKITRYLTDLKIPPRDFRLAVVEAGEGRVGTSIDKVLLTCFRYDAMTKSYTPFVFGFVRIGAGLSAAALAIVMAVLWRRESLMRRRRAA